jgi:hypothetical protein
MRRTLACLLIAAAIGPMAAEASLKPGDPVYDAIAKRVEIPSGSDVEVFPANRIPRIGSPYQFPELRNIPVLGAVARWDKKLPVIYDGILVYEPSQNTLGSVATLERFLRKTAYQEPAGAKAITEDQPGGPRRDVWCPNDRTFGARALVLDISMVDGLPALTVSRPHYETLPECAKNQPARGQ